MSGIAGPSCEAELVPLETMVPSELPLVLDESGESELDEVSQVDSQSEEQQITEKYLKGEISFTEFMDLSEQLHEPTEQSDVDGKMHAGTIKQPGFEQVIQVELMLDKEHRKMRRKGPAGRRSKLPRDLQGLMGEANLCFARGEHEEAIKMCMEIIRLVPTAPEPFQTLGMLYEEMGDVERSLQFSLIAAHLSPIDVEEWVKLAEMSLEQGNIKQAVTCYSKAIKGEPQNPGLLWERCKCYEALHEQKRALEGYLVILNLLEPSDGDKFMHLSKDIARIQHESGDVLLAIATMEAAFQAHPLSITSEDINLALELYISQKQFHSSLDLICRHCGVKILYKVHDEKAPATDRYNIPDALPIDLRIKLVVCLIHLSYNIAQMIVQPLFQESPEDMGDLCLDVAEAYMEVGSYQDALPILSTLVNSHSYNLAAVWLRYGECLNALGQMQNAVQAYRQVVDLAPSHMSARMTLSSLQQQLGRHDEALLALTHVEHDASGEAVAPDLALLLQRCNLLYSQAKWQEFVRCSKHALSSQFKDVVRPSYLGVIIKNRSLRHRKEALRYLGCNMESTSEGLFTNEKSASPDDMWDLYCRVCHKMHELGKHAELETFTIAALTSSQFMNDPDKAKEAEFMCLMACYMNKNFEFAYNIIKEICVKEMKNNSAWNLLCQIITWSDDIRHNRFCMRLLMKQPDHLPLEMLNGHNSVVAGSYKHSLGEYVAAFRQAPKDPLISLCIGLTFFHLASQKFSSKRHSLVVQGCSFLNQYVELRGECQETFYNLGRAMHQLGLLYAAVYYYKRALAVGPAIKEDHHQELFDLKRETAFNLSLIYQHSGNNDLARMVLNEHCIV
ncbi:PREDICTED: general transcription factor 3C polypeptide 3-like isoform X2 [Priapulus caudatus]|nr:PREDICTED: general transcription factor 3C polypeptide 3-like isoform X2 [Priapulus caudatus]